SPYSHALPVLPCPFSSFFFTATPTTQIYTLSLHDALPISSPPRARLADRVQWATVRVPALAIPPPSAARPWLIVRPSRTAATPVPSSKTRLASVPLTATSSAPGPSMVKGSVMLSGTPPRAIVPCSPSAKRTSSGPGVGVEDRLAQRAVAAAGQVQDREGAGDGAVLQGLDR